MLRHHHDQRHHGQRHHGQRHHDHQGPRHRGLRQPDQGATAVEYALLAALIAAVIFVAVGALGIATEDLFTRVDFP